MKEIRYEITETKCWECISHAKDTNGYPVATIGGKWDRIHRHYYRIYNGDIGKGLVIRHTCDNRSCINPSHLIIGTHADNVRDKIERGRSGNCTGINHPKCKLTEEQVRIIRIDDCTPKMVLARKFGVDPKVIRDIKQRKTWRCLNP